MRLNYKPCLMCCRTIVADGCEGEIINTRNYVSIEQRVGLKPGFFLLGYTPRPEGRG
jgi:hypothetical protein